MESDGSIDENVSCELTFCADAPAAGALELIRSLGIKVSMTSGPAAITEPNPEAAGLGLPFVHLAATDGDGPHEEVVLASDGPFGHPKLDALAQLVADRCPTHLVWIDSEARGGDDTGTPLAESVAEIAGEHECRVLALTVPDAAAVAAFLDDCEEEPLTCGTESAAPGDADDGREPSAAAGAVPNLEEFDFDATERPATPGPAATPRAPGHVLGTNEEEFSF